MIRFDVERMRSHGTPLTKGDSCDDPSTLHPSRSRPRGREAASRARRAAGPPSRRSRAAPCCRSSARSSGSASIPRTPTTPTRTTPARPTAPRWPSGSTRSRPPTTNLGPAVRRRRPPGRRPDHGRLQHRRVVPPAGGDGQPGAVRRHLGGLPSNGTASIWMSYFDASGISLTGPVLVSDVGLQEVDPDVAASDGSFVITWNRSGVGQARHRRRAVRDLRRRPAGPGHLRASRPSKSVLLSPSVAMAPDGRFDIAYRLVGFAFNTVLIRHLREPVRRRREPRPRQHPDQYRCRRQVQAEHRDGRLRQRGGRLRPDFSAAASASTPTGSAAAGPSAA